MNNRFNKSSELDRRSFMSRVAKIALDAHVGTTFINPALAATLPQTDKKLIFLYMAGGMSHLDTFAPHPGTAEALYGTKSKFGQGCLLARRLIEHGVRCVEVTKGGWDMHAAMPEDHARDLDRALAALMADLQQRGLLESTIVVVATEFGRNPEIKEESLGRDHWAKAFSTVIGGGGIKTGQVIGSTDRGHEVTEDKVLIPDLHATIGTLMGMPIKVVVMSDSGRPFNVGYIRAAHSCPHLNLPETGNLTRFA